MSSLVIFVLMIVTGASTTPLSSREREIEVTLTSSSGKSFNDVNFDIEDLRKLSRTRKCCTVSEGIETSEKSLTKNNEEIFYVTESKEDQRAKTALKKARKHKTFFLNYPFLPRANRNQQTIGSYEKNLPNYDHPEGRRKLTNRKSYLPDSQIHYIKLPPTPYSYVPGFGYISQPPTYSTSGLQRPSITQRPSRPQSNYDKPTNKNKIIKIPIDFVSNGKPMGVYEWSAKKRDSSVTRLNEGPYVFNGRPTNLYLLNSDGSKTGHQPIRIGWISGIFLAAFLLHNRLLQVVYPKFEK